MITPKTIYDQAISNWPSATFLRQCCDEELANDPTPALVYQVPPVASVQEAAMDQRTRWLASTDPALCGERDDELLAVL